MKSASGQNKRFFAQKKAALETLFAFCFFSVYVKYIYIMAQTTWFQRQKIVERLKISAFFNLIIG